MAAVPMPAATERNAPKFDGDGRTLLQFFKDYKILATNAQLSPEETIQQTVKYMTKEPRKLTEKLAEFKDKDWDKFVKRVKENYTDVDEPAEITHAEFDKFVIDSQSLRFTTEDELVKFTSKYRYMCSDAFEKGELSVNEVNKTYYSLVLPSFGTDLTIELRDRQSKEKTPKKPWQCTVAQVLEAARSVLKDAQYAPGFLLGTDAISKIAAPAASVPSAPIKQEERLFSLLTDIKTQVSAYGERISRLEGQRQQPQVQPTTSVSAPGATIQTSTYQRQLPPNDNCHYCGLLGERVRDCEKVKVDMAAGRVKREDSPPFRLINMDGSMIRRPPGRWLRDGVNEWHAQKAKGTPSASAMLIEVCEEWFAPEDEPEFEDGDAREAWYQVMNANASATGERRYPLRNRVPVQKPSAPGSRERPPHVDKAKVDRIPPQHVTATRPAPGANPGSATSRQQSPVIINTPPAPAPVPQSAHAPQVTTRPATDAQPLPPALQQFRLKAPIENEGLVAQVTRRILESKIVLSAEEVLALCPSMRRHWNDQLSTKRVTVGLVDAAQDVGAASVPDGPDDASAYLFREVAQADEGSRDLISAPLVLPLRYLDCRVSSADRSFVAEGVIDNGSQMVLISKRFWEALGKPLDFDRRVSLEAANNTTASTIGLCANLSISVGGLDFLLHAQVVEEAPFSLLLGRPFLALACATEETARNGSSVFTLNCPNTARAVRIPTRARRAQRPESMPLDF